MNKISEKRKLFFIIVGLFLRGLNYKNLLKKMKDSENMV